MTDFISLFLFVIWRKCISVMLLVTSNRAADLIVCDASVSIIISLFILISAHKVKISTAESGKPKTQSTVVSFHTRR